MSNKYTNPLEVHKDKNFPLILPADTIKYGARSIQGFCCTTLLCVNVQCSECVMFSNDVASLLPRQIQLMEYLLKHKDDIEIAEYQESTTEK